MKCLLVSFFNSSNIGDCLIADTLYNMASQKFETKKYSYSGNPNIITDINDIVGTNFPVTTNMKGKIYNSIKKTKLTLPISIYRKFKSSNEMKGDFEKNIIESDLLIIGGGNMIFDKDKFSNSGKRFNDLVSIAKKHKKTIFAVSIGIGPFQTLNQEKNAVMALRKCDYITFRDKKSFNIYHSHINEIENVHLTVDPVFSLPNITEPKLSNEITIGLNVFNSKLINDSEEEYKKLIRSYVSLAEKLINDLGVKVILFSTDLKDSTAVNDVMKSFSNNKNVEIENINGYDSLIDLYGKLTLLIGARMHSLIIAYTQNIPVIGLSWQPKVDAFFEIIQSEKLVYKYNSIDENVHFILSTCEEIIGNIEEEKKRIEKQLRVVVRKSNIDKEIMKTLNEKSVIK